MAHQQITLTLPDEALRIIESRIAFGSHLGDPHGVFSARSERTQSTLVNDLAD